MASQQPDARTALAARRDTSTDIATTTPPPLEKRIQALTTQWAIALPRGMEAVRFVRDALTCLRTIRDLHKCDPESVLGALMTCAQLGLRPGVLGHAWPLPYWDGRTQQHRAQLVIGYQGLIELGHRSGQIKSLIARTVYANDVFDVDYGLADSLVHKPELRGTRGEPVAYYAIAKFTSGGHAFVVMTHQDMIEHRDRYAPKNKQRQIVGPWVDSFEQMALKTTVRQLAKYIPKSTELAEAIAADGGVRADVSPTTPAVDVTGHDATVWEATEADPSAAVEEPPVSSPPVAEPEVVVKPSAALLKRMFALLNAADISDDRDLALAWITATIGREIAHRDELSANEVKTVCAALERRIAILDDLDTLRNQLPEYAGDSDDARDVFMVYVAGVVDREIESTKDLTTTEIAAVTASLRAAIAATATVGGGDG